MEKQETSINLEDIKLVGIKVRTSYQNEINKMEGKIFPCVQQYFHQQLFEKISYRKKPGTTFCVYTEYENDYMGEYTYFIGEEVISIDQVSESLSTLIIPPQKYAKFTTHPGSMPNVIVEAWQKIWQMSSKELGGSRRYHTDFEIYDERAQDHQNIVLDLYIGID